MAVRLVPVVLSAVLLAAHFSRADAFLLTALSLAFPLVLLVRSPWAPRAVQAILVIGALEWVRTAARLAAGRAELGQPWLRLAAILGSVAVLTLASALVFRSPRLRRIWLGRGEVDGRGGVSGAR
ncbi:MAG: hypothetical protein R6X22_07265 [Gemmatimonadota bacterium]